jgi:hypothetical protein
MDSIGAVIYPVVVTEHDRHNTKNEGQLYVEPNLEIPPSVFILSLI